MTIEEANKVLGMENITTESPGGKIEEGPGGILEDQHHCP